MATLGLMLDPRNTTSEKLPLVIRVTHKRKRKYIPLGYILSPVNPKEWNADTKQVTSKYPNSKRTNLKIQKKMTLASEVLSENDSILSKLAVEDLRDMINERFQELETEKTTAVVARKMKLTTSLYAYTQKVEARYEKAGKYGSRDTFKDALNLIYRFKLNDDALWDKIIIDIKAGKKEHPFLIHLKETLLLTDINETFLEDLEADFISRTNCRGEYNSLGGLGPHLRALRRIFNLAIKDKETEVNRDDYPFGNEGYSIKKGNPKKRAVKIDVIEKMEKLDYTKDSPIWHHRNYFLFSFYMRGMNFIDLAYLKISNIENNRIIYRRRKTRHAASSSEFDIQVPKKAMDILKHYIGNKKSDQLVFPILEKVIDCGDGGKIHDYYKRSRKNHNKRLNTISKALGLSKNLTTYVARHTFATAGLHKGISKAQIGDMLGHANYNTTEAYLSGFDKETLDDAANSIFD